MLSKEPRKPSSIVRRRRLELAAKGLAALLVSVGVILLSLDLGEFGHLIVFPIAILWMLGRAKWLNHTRGAREVARDLRNEWGLKKRKKKKKYGDRYRGFTGSVQGRRVKVEFLGSAGHDANVTLTLKVKKLPMSVTFSFDTFGVRTPIKTRDGLFESKIRVDEAVPLRFLDAKTRSLVFALFDGRPGELRLKRGGHLSLTLEQTRRFDELERALSLMVELSEHQRSVPKEPDMALLSAFRAETDPVAAQTFLNRLLEAHPNSHAARLANEIAEERRAPKRRRGGKLALVEHTPLGTAADGGLALARQPGELTTASSSVPSSSGSTKDTSDASEDPLQ